MFADATTEDCICARPNHMIDRHPSLVVLTSRLPWQQIEASVAHPRPRKAHAGCAMPDLDLFGEAPAPVRRPSNAGRPHVRLRTRIALHHLRHASNLSDEALIQGCSESARALKEWAGQQI